MFDPWSQSSVFYDPNGVNFPTVTAKDGSTQANLQFYFTVNGNKLAPNTLSGDQAGASGAAYFEAAYRR